jgi:hypothetical protein
LERNKTCTQLAFFKNKLVDTTCIFKKPKRIVRLGGKRERERERDRDREEYVRGENELHYKLLTAMRVEKIYLITKRIRKGTAKGWPLNSSD